MHQLSELKKTAIKLGKNDNLILCILLVGSYARNEQRPDSDIDFVIISKDKTKMINTYEWINIIGKTESEVKIEYYGEITSLRANCKGYEYEIGIGSEKWIELPLDSGTRKVLEDRYIVMYEKDNVMKNVKSEVREREEV